MSLSLWVTAHHPLLCIRSVRSMQALFFHAIQGRANATDSFLISSADLSILERSIVPMDPALIGIPLLHRVGSPTTLNGQTAFIIADPLFIGLVGTCRFP